MKLAIGSDHAGLPLKTALKPYLDSRLIPYEDFGTDTADSVDYPRIAEKVCKAILSGQFDRGILICGTGIGMSITANKFPGIRAAAVSEPFSAILAKRHNNANVLCMGARVVGTGLATLITEGWLNASFEGDRHQRRLDIISRIEQRNQTSAPLTTHAPEVVEKTEEDTRKLPTDGE
ncbi:MAG: ribose 5-phosphate isomerase B [Anaerolineaceae bacterium]|jgi:ribose 5-phosphate isomerase B